MDSFKMYKAQKTKDLLFFNPTFIIHILVFKHLLYTILIFIFRIYTTTVTMHNKLKIIFKKCFHIHVFDNTEI